MTALRGQLIAAGLGKATNDTMVAEEPEGTGCHPRALFVGFGDISRITSEVLAKILVAEAADSETWIGYGLQKSN